MAINELPDEVLIEIFDFYMACPLPPPSHELEEDAWHTLVHVCRRWRHVVFGSPRRLNLRLLCRNRRLVKTLDIWPELPIVIHVDGWTICEPPSGTNVISVLKRHDRVCKIFIDSVPTSLLEELATISEPFPALIELELESYKTDVPILPDSFLGGSVPRLRSLDLWGIPFPGIGNLLLSTRDLVTLSLGDIPPSGYISPESMVTILSGLTRLKSLELYHIETAEFWTHGASRRPPELTRVVLPALTNLTFSGDSEYLEDMVSRIDASLESIAMTFFDELVFDIPLLRAFIGHTKILVAPHRADTSFSNFELRISLFQRKGEIDFGVLNLEIICDIDSQLSSLARAWSLLLPPLPSLEHLGIYASADLQSQWHYEVAITQWMEFLRLFTTVKDLVLDEPATLSVSSAMQELVGERATEFLPALQTIFLEGFQSSGPFPGGIGEFIAARELSGRPVIVTYR